MPSSVGLTRGRCARLRRVGSGALVLLLSACSATAERCADPAGWLDEERRFTCEEAHQAQRYVEVLASRPLSEGQRRALMEGLAARGADAPEELGERLRLSRSFVGDISRLPPREAGLRRSQEVRAATHSGGVFPPDTWADVASVVSQAAAVWASDEASGLSLTEMDIEGWIKLASLCREVQGGPALRVSIADRVALYEAVRVRFKEGDASVQRAMVGVGPFWSTVRSHWKAASYETQQAWIGSAPLPPPMTADSTGYVRALLAVDLGGLVDSVHASLGPLVLDVPP